MTSRKVRKSPKSGKKSLGVKRTYKVTVVNKLRTYKSKPELDGVIRNITSQVKSAKVANRSHSRSGHTAEIVRNYTVKSGAPESAVKSSFEAANKGARVIVKQVTSLI